MSIRTATRYVMRRNTEHPDTDVTFEAESLRCGWKATPADDPAPVDRH